VVAAEAATAVMIALALQPGVLSTLLVRREMRWLGVRSYGIYLWHWPIVVLVRPGTTADWPAVTAAIAIVGAGLLLGALSWRYVERPFLVRKEPTVRQGLALRVALLGLAVAVVGVALARITYGQAVIAAGRQLDFQSGHEV